MIIYSVTRIIISCCDEEGFNYDYSNITLSAGNDIVNNIVNIKDSVSFEDLIVQIDFEYTIIAQNPPNSSFDLYAFDCRPLYESEKKIKDISVITVGDFNNQYLSGSEVDVNYKVFGYSSMDFTGTKDFVIDHLNNRSTREPNEIVYFKLKEKPTTNESHQLAVKIEFNDNSTISDTTGIVYIRE